MDFYTIVRHCTVPAAVLLFNVTTAITGDEGTESKISTKVHGYASLEGGEIVKGLALLGATNIDHAWLQTGYMCIYLETAINDRLQIKVGGEAQSIISFRRFDIGNNEAYVGNLMPRTVLNIKWGEALYKFGIGDKLRLYLEAGLFPYKYNPEARNLGEFLFRSYCYPSSIVAEFDKPYADLTGFRLGNSINIGNKVFHNDLILTTQMKFWPYQNYSLSYLNNFNIPKLLSVGTGVAWWNLFSVIAAGSESSVGDDPTTPFIENWGGKYYTFAGTKLMGRISIDGKGILPPDLSKFFGKEDLKFYGEAAILGLKNYHGDSVLFNGNMVWRPSFYDSLKWRAPIMFGMNIPTAKVFDVLSLEFEYQNSPYPNSIHQVIYQQKPLPTTNADLMNTHAQWKWSLYVKRTLLNHVSIIGQIARDHITPMTLEMSNSNCDFTDITLRPGDYWWTLKMRFDF